MLRAGRQVTGQPLIYDPRLRVATSHPPQWYGLGPPPARIASGALLGASGRTWAVLGAPRGYLGVAWRFLDAVLALTLCLLNLYCALIHFFNVSFDFSLVFDVRSMLSSLLFDLLSWFSLSLSISFFRALFLPLFLSERPGTHHSTTAPQGGGVGFPCPYPSGGGPGG